MSLAVPVPSPPSPRHADAPAPSSQEDRPAAPECTHHAGAAHGALRPGPEDVAAARIAFERGIRGWGTSQVADEMNAAGCPMNPSAVWRIEKGTPRRRIHLDEAVGFAALFGLRLEELYEPGGAAAHRRAAELAATVRLRRRAAAEATEALDAAEHTLTAYHRAHPGPGHRAEDHGPATGPTP
ncbi:hypothetical protein OK074_5030 [Actinobacteria bacterium OK074]|nr:hypothetical protein OK074_5030 [Actinobacteria bacterium OK074]